MGNQITIKRLALASLAIPSMVAALVDVPRTFNNLADHSPRSVKVERQSPKLSSRNASINKRQGDEEHKEPPPSPPKANQIFLNFNRHPGRTYVRFVLADSVEFPFKPSVPVVIDTYKCTGYGPLNDTNALDKYNEGHLQTYPLSEDVVNSRACQSYFIRDAAPEDYFPVIDETRFGWPVVVTISNDTDSLIGWKTSKAVQPEADAQIRWVEKVDKKLPENQLYLDCDKWWHQSEIHWFSPQYYARECQLKILSGEASTGGKPKFTCIGSKTADIDKLKEGVPLVYEDCDTKRESRNQIWHIQAVAQEWPFYYRNGDPMLKTDEKGPRAFFNCSTYGTCLK